MAARAIGTSTISFGLVSVPVKLYSTSETGKKVSFNLLSKECGTRLRQQYICPESGDVVPREDIVKGYEFAKGQFVTFTPEELKAVETPKGESIEITEFVPADLVERLYFDKTYFLGPDKGGTRAYRLLSAALRDTGRVAIAKYAARGKQYLVMVRPLDDGLVMEQLRYSDEVKAFDEVPIEEGEVSEAELALAVQLIKQAATDTFDPTRYHDEVRDRMLELIQQKVDGEDITVAPQEDPQVQIIDLMSALKASLSGDDGDDAGRKPAGKASKRGASGKSSSKKVASG